MLRKIHSNRDPNTTIYSELRKEFGVYLLRLRRTGKAIVKANPKTSFVSMLVSLIASGILCFTIERNHEPVKLLPAAPSNFARIPSLAGLIRQSFVWTHEIDSLNAKRELSHQDSLTLEKDLDSLSHFNKTFKP